MFLANVFKQRATRFMIQTIWQRHTRFTIVLCTSWQKSHQSVKVDSHDTTFLTTSFPSLWPIYGQWHILIIFRFEVQSLSQWKNSVDTNLFAEFFTEIVVFLCCDWPGWSEYVSGCVNFFWEKCCVPQIIVPNNIIVHTINLMLTKSSWCTCQ